MSLVGCAFSLLLLVAAFVYLFSPTSAMRLFKKLALRLVVASLALAAIAQLARQANPLAVAIALLLVSLAAYLIREHRLRRPQRRERPSGVERRPLLPKDTGGDD